MNINFEVLEEKFIKLMIRFFILSIRSIDSKELNKMDLNGLCYLFKDSFNEIKKTMGWIDKKDPSGARIHKTRITMIIDLRNFKEHNLTEFLNDDSLQYFSLLNYLLFIKSLKSKFQNDDESKSIFTECENILNNYINSYAKASVRVKIIPKKKVNGNNNTEIKDKFNDLTQLIKHYHKITLDNFSNISNLIKNNVNVQNNELEANQNIQLRFHPIITNQPASNNNDDEDLKWFNSINASTWFEFSGIAAENDWFTPRARAFLYKLGLIKANGWKISERQLSWARDLYNRMISRLNGKNPQNERNQNNNGFADDIPF